MRGLVFAVTLVLSLLSPCLAASVLAQSQSLWKAQCTNDKCGAAISVNNEETQKKILVFTLLFDKTKENYSFLLVTPLGTALEAGARLIYDGSEVPLSYRVCLNDGCRAVGDLPPDTLKKMFGTKFIEVRFFSISQSSPFSVKFPSEGLEQAIAEARKQ